MLRIIKIFIWFAALMVVNSLSFGQTITILPGNARGFDRIPGFIKLDTGLYLPFHNCLPWGYNNPQIPDYFRLSVSPHDSLPYYIKKPYDSLRILTIADTILFPHSFTPDSLIFFTHTQFNDSAKAFVRYIDSTIKYITPTQLYDTAILKLNIADTSSMLANYLTGLNTLPTLLPIGDTTYLFRKSDSNTNGHAITLNYFNSHSGVGTLTSFSSNSLSPLFTTTVANSMTTPALSFAPISQTQNLALLSPNGSSGNPTFRAIGYTDLPTSVDSTTLYFNVDGGGNVINTTITRSLRCNIPCTLVWWQVDADQSGSVVIDIKRGGTSIIGGGNSPTLSTQQTAKQTISSWTSVTIAKGDLLVFSITSLLTLTWFNLYLYGTKN